MAVKKGWALPALFSALFLALSCAGPARAEIPAYSQRETFDVVFSVSQNPHQAVAATMKLVYDHDAFELVPSSFAQNDAAFMLDMNGIAEGASGTVSFRVLPGAQDGEYTLRMDVVQAGDINETFVTDLAFAPVTVRVGEPPAPAPKARMDNEYYADGRLKTAYDYNDQGFLAWKTEYNRYGKISEVWTADSFDQAGNALTATASYPGEQGKWIQRTFSSAYDADGREISREAVFLNGSFGFRQEMTYDSQGRIASLTDYTSRGSVNSVQTDYRYDGEGHVLGYTVLDKKGKVIRTCRQEWENGVMVRSCELSPEGEVSVQYEYDPVYGDEVSYTMYGSRVLYKTTWTYGPDGFEEESDNRYVRGAFHSRSVTQYDTYGRKTGRINYDENGEAEDIYTLEYGNRGAYVKTIRWGSGTMSVYEYDEKGNEIKYSWYSDGALYKYEVSEYDSRGSVLQKTEYSAEGQVKSVRKSEYDSRGWETYCVYLNADGSKSSEYFYAYNSEGTRIDTYYSYFSSHYTVSEDGENGSVAKKSDYDLDGTLRNYILYEYNENGDKTRETKYDPNGAVLGYDTYERDQNGKMTRHTVYNADGKITDDYHYEYDEFGQDKTSICYYPNGAVKWRKEYRYDENGKQQEKTDYYNEDGTLSKEGEWK